MSLTPSRGITDADYFLLRVQSEAKAADRARSAQSAEAHHRLASGYLDLLFGVGSSTRGPGATLGARVKREALLTPFKMLPPVGSSSDYSAYLEQLP
jgi:hypothetical protein